MDISSGHDAAFSVGVLKYGRAVGPIGRWDGPGNAHDSPTVGIVRHTRFFYDRASACLRNEISEARLAFLPGLVFYRRDK